MPLYTFYNVDTDEVFDELLSLSGREQYLANNKNIQPLPTSAAIVSGVSLTDKVPSGFKEVLSKISEQNPNSSVADKVGGRGIKDAKIKSIVDKHVAKITKRLES